MRRGSVRCLLALLMCVMVCDVRTKPTAGPQASFIELLMQGSAPMKGKPPNLEHEKNSEFWFYGAQDELLQKLHQTIDLRPVRNVIMFLGDGMSLPTLAAARVYKGQVHGKPDETSKLAWDEFPFTGFAKTYCVDYQVADSACSATAYLGGIKGNEGTIGVNGHVPFGNCSAMQNPNNYVTSIVKWSQDAKKSTGLVTTTRVTHSTPAGIYAHTAHRDWECDADVIAAKENPQLCTDIAQQLIYGETGSKLNVILGGGRKQFLPKQFVDDEGQKGRREDGQNLIMQWQNLWKSKGESAQYVWNRQQLLNVPQKTNRLLGLFEADHMQYHLDANPQTEPTLAEMTKSAIKVLQGNENGFFLFVEGGKIDIGHHETRAHKALDETAELSVAVEEAMKMVNMQETLIIVTADHSHTMSYAGYAKRGNSIFGQAGISTIDGMPYSTLSYANGPGYKPASPNSSTRYNMSRDDTGDKNYQFPATAPLVSETHGGEDVAVFAKGPWAHLFTGVYEQNVLPHLLGYVSCVGNGLTLCSQILLYY